ncbi:MAG: fibronectin type III domain-containing protein [Nitrospira sp.]|nr:MAG: fibronectin type III domain-containing protein [Nitrospira sp.]
MMRASFGRVIFTVVGVAFGGCTGGGGGDSTPPAAQDPAGTASLTFQWDPVSVSDLAGYRIYRSTTAGIYGSPIATLSASTTTYQITNLTKGVTYFFAVSAYDTSGNESPLSNEQSRTIP